MNYEFTLLETWINPVSLATVQKKALLTQWQEEMHSETERIKNAWRQAACIQQEIPFWKRYVRQHQLAFIELSEKLAGLPEDMAVERLSVSTALETLFLFLADSFPQEIDHAMTIRLAAFPALTQSIGQSLSVLEQQLKVLPLADALLQDALFPLREWQQYHLSPMSFERIRFNRVLQQSLLHFTQEVHAPAHLQKDLINHFCYINYNSNRFCQTIQTLIGEAVDRQRDTLEQLRYLRQLYKHFKHLPVREDLRYQPDGRILARSLSDWLLLQIISKEKESQVLLLEIESLSEEELKGATKVMTSQTVDEMDLMVRLFFETGLFRNSKMRPVVQLIAKTFRSLTKGVSDDIGEAFLWQSMYKIQLAPFIRYDQLNYNQVKQALQEFMFNINTPTRVGFQTPFTNITLDLKVPGFLKEQPVIIGGKMQDACYGDFQAEMDLFNAAFAEVMEEGDANGSVFSFPIPTYNITPDFEWDNPAYQKIWEITAKYGIPYFSNFVNSDMSPDDVRSMCCRLRLDKRELQKRGGGLFGANPLTGSVGVVTINMPRLGYESKSEAEFFQRLDKLMELAKESLETKRKVIETLTEKGLYPYSRFYLRNVKKRFDYYWKNHFSTIGIIGMNECTLNFLGCNLIQEKGHDFTVRVMDYMRSKLEVFQEETGNIYNLEATPAEGTSYRLAKTDKAEYPDIIVANEIHVKKGANPYYTNSTQLPVAYTDDLFEALTLQDELQTKYTGGTVFHIFMGEGQLNTEAVKTLIKKVTGTFRLPYITLSPTFSICPEHGYLFGEHQSCPTCKEETGKEVKCEVFSRIVGYLRPVEQWNDGKQEEFKERKMFDNNGIDKR